MNGHFNFEDSQIIKPPTGNRTFRRITVDVNSSSRNYTSYPTPNQYTYYLNTEISNIAEIEISSINIPSSLYNVNAFNNKIYFAQNINVATSYDKNGKSVRDNTDYLLQANMPKGNYKISISDATNLVTADDFASNLVSILDANLTTNFAVTAQVNTSKYEINPTTNISSNQTMLFYNSNNLEDVIMNAGTASQQNKLLTNTMGELVGMTRTYCPFISGNVNTTASNATITGQGTSFLTDLAHLDADDQISIVNADINGPTIFETLQITSIDSDTQITLKGSTLPTLSRNNCELAPIKFIGNAQHNIEGDDVIYLHIEEFHKMEANKTGSQNAFCKINMNKGTVERMAPHSNLIYGTSHLEKKLERINKLTIKFTDVYGNIVDFNGREHNFTLEFSCYSQKAHY